MDEEITQLTAGEQFMADEADARAMQQQAEQQLIQEQAAQQEAEQPPAEQPTFLSETGAALAGGTAAAVESVGSFAELTGDTLKTGLNALLGRPVDSSQNPFSNDYESGDANWLDIPDEWVPENQTGLGKLARGLVEFGVLTAATGGVGGAAAGSLRLGVRGLAAARAMGVGAKGIRNIKFIGKGARIAGEGAFAELISEGSEEANMMNLVEEHTPWMSTWFSNALAVDDDDNPWAARIKTTLVGAGMNGVAHTLVGFIKGRAVAIRAKKAGATDEAADAAGNAKMAEYIEEQNAIDAAGRQEMADDNFANGMGIRGGDPLDAYLKKYLTKQEYKAFKGGADDVDYETLAKTRGKGANDAFNEETGKSLQQELDDMGREPDPFNNPDKFNPSDQATFGKDTDAVNRNIKESVADARAGGTGQSSTFWLTEASLKKISRGDKNIEEYVLDVADDLAKKAFKLPENTLDHDELVQLIIRQTNDLTSMIEGGGDIAQNFSDYFKKKKDYRAYVDNGKEIVTGTPSMKAALQLTINTLAKKAQGIATGAVQMGDKGSIYRQADTVFDAMKVALIEHKKIGYMWGLDGRWQQVGFVPDQFKKATKKQIDQMTKEVDEFIEELKRLEKTGRTQELKDLLEIHAITPKVRTLEHVYDWLKAKMYGGEVQGVQIRGEARKQMQGHFYNSILSAPLTPIKAITGTNFVAALRPFEAWLGATLRGDKTEAVIAAAQIDAIGRSFGESWQMFKHSWDAGLNRKAMPYDMKYDVGADIAEWQQLEDYISRYGSDADKLAYNLINRSVNWNTHPFVKYSQNAMGAGDAFARTVVGRMEMRARAARRLIDDGVDFKDVKELSAKYEEYFRNQIFSKNADGRYVVTDAAAKYAGDEAAMTRALEGNMAGFEQLANVPFMKAFFPFVRTGFNSLGLAFEHTSLQRLMKRRNDIMKGVDIEKYGIRPEDLEQARALLQGREALGNTIIGMAVVAALTGNMTGDPPLDPATRKNMQAKKIPFNSFKVPGTNTYVSYGNIEPFNTLFAMTANVINNATVLGEEWTENWIKKITFMASAVLVDKSMLAGVEDLARLMNPDTSENLLTETAVTYGRSHLPFAGMMKSLGDVTDANRKEAQNLLEMITKNDVLVKSLGNPKYDILAKDRSGKKLTPSDNPLLNLFNELSPIPITFAEDDSVKQTLLETRFNLPQELSTYKDEPLNAYEMSQMQLYLSKGPLRKELERLFGSKKWQDDFNAYRSGNKFTKANDVELTKQGWYRDIRAIFSAAKAEAISEFLHDNPEFRDRVETRKIKSALGGSGSYEALLRYMERTGK